MRLTTRESSAAGLGASRWTNVSGLSVLWSRVPALRSRMPSMEMAANVVTVALVVAVGFTAAQLTWRLWPNATAHVALPSIQLRDVDAVTARRTDYGGVLSSLHLFGQASKVEEPAPVQVVSAPKTTLLLTLRGIFLLGSADKAVAIIADSSGSEQPYRVGDKVPGGAEINKILPDRVLLARSGRLEVLELQSEGVGGVPSGSSGAGGKTASRLGRIREQIAKRPYDAAKYLVIEPVSVRGKLKGYRVGPGRDDALFRASRLSEDDVVTKVNGIAVNDPDALGRLMQQLTTASDLTLEVERGRRKRTVHVQLD